MLAWLKKLFSSDKVEAITPAAPIETPVAPETPAETMTGAEEIVEEAPAEDMK